MKKKFSIFNLKFEFKLKISNLKFPAKRGFTLIEIIIGLAIISLLFLVGFASYQEFARRQALNTAYGQVKSSLELAQQLALSGEKPDDCTRAGKILSSYKVSFYSDRDSYEIHAVCRTTSAPFTDTEILKKTIQLPPGVRVSVTLAVSYKVLGQGKDPSIDQDFEFTQSSTGRTLPVSITQEGSLKRR